MRRYSMLVAALLIINFSGEKMMGQDNYEHDNINAQGGEIELWFIGHGTLMFKYMGKVIHIDPVMREGNYKVLPKADLILITHSHGDHLDPEAVKMITDATTELVCNSQSAVDLEEPVVMSNGDKRNFDGIKVEAVPAYNIVHKRQNGTPYHPEGDGNGYIITLGGKRIYVAGDTEDIPEMKNLGHIDVAFLPVNLPYTMDINMAIRAAKLVNPEIFYPYHYGSTDLDGLVKGLEGSGIEIRIRKLQ